MKVKITCPKCGSSNVSIISDVSNLENPTPMYKCNKCMYKHRLFPGFESDKNRESEEGEE